MPSPVRFSSGFTQDTIRQPLGLIGQPDPFFYNTFQDDFTPFVAAMYTATNTGNGTVAATAGDGGLITFTTNSSTPAAGDVSAIQPPVGSFTLSGQFKWAFLARIRLADALNPAVNLGLIQTTTTPFTVTDGVVISKATGATFPTVLVRSGSVTQASVSLSGLFAFANNVTADIGFVYDDHNDLLIFAGSNLIGSGGGTPINALPAKGPIARIPGVGSLTLTAASLSPTLALQSGTATSKTMVADFLYSAKER